MSDGVVLFVCVFVFEMRSVHREGGGRGGGEEGGREGGRADWSRAMVGLQGDLHTDIDGGLSCTRE